MWKYTEYTFFLYNTTVEVYRDPGKGKVIAETNDLSWKHLIATGFVPASWSPVDQSSNQFSYLPAKHKVRDIQHTKEILWYKRNVPK